MNKFIDEIKQSIYQGIEEEQARMEEKYNKDKMKIEKLNTVPEVIKELVNIYGNSMEQREIMIPILQKYLEADFFKEAEVVGRANFIHFQRGEYFIEFATSRMYSINIGRTEILRKPIKPLSVSEDILAFNELWDHYKKTGEKYDEVVNLYSSMTRDMGTGFIFRKRVKEEAIEEYVNKNKQHIENVNEKMKRWEEELENNEREKEMLYEIIRDVKDDLIKFRDCGWHIKYLNLNGFEGYEI